jgi:WXG100 family type VII secretion target
MAFEGMDTTAVRGYASQLDNQAHSINGVINAINGIVSQMESTWKGHDAQQFQEWWLQQHRPALLAAENAISGLATSARNNASQQDSTSAS